MNYNVLVLKSEAKYEENIKNAAEFIVNTPKKIFALCGPSSAGKTTTAGRIKQYLEKSGRSLRIISMDDFFKNRAEAFLFPDGTPDYDRFEHLNLDLFVSVMKRINNSEKMLLPRFDFLSGNRKDNAEYYDSSEDDEVVFEGIHAFNPAIEEALGFEIPKIYIDILPEETKVGNFSDRDIRFIRRLVRDNKFRGASAEKTLALWENVTRCEDKYIKPYSKNADFAFHTFHDYELNLLKDYAVPLLSENTNKDEWQNYLKFQEFL